MCIRDRYIGEYDPDGSAYINVWNDTYDVTTYANEDDFILLTLLMGYTIFMYQLLDMTPIIWKMLLK